MNIVEYKNLSISFYNEKNKVEAVKNVSFNLRKGEVLGIVGESGSGKTVTAMSLVGLINNQQGKIEKGQIFFDGVDITAFSEKQLELIRGSKIAIIPQDPLASLNPVYTIGHQIIEGMLFHSKISKKEAKKEAIKMLERVGIENAEKVFDFYPNQLSGGMRQRCVIAIALCLKPEVLIADECTTALDVTVQAQIIKLLKEIKDEFNISIIVISHDFGVIAELCDYVVVMKNGEVVEQDDIFTLFNEAKHPYTRELLEIRNIKSEYIKNSNNNEVILELKNINKRFPIKKNFFGQVKESFVAADDISFTLKKGETLAIVGESGSGKSTIANIIIGLLKSDSGQIIKDINDKKNFIQMIFQDPYSSLDPSMKIRDIIGEAMLYHKIISKDNLEDEIERLLLICGLDKQIIDRYPHEFSGGQRQRIAIARALSLNPSIIIADEAVSSLDLSMQKRIIKLLVDIQKEKKISYIFISHDLELVKEIATRVVVMYKGKIVESGLIKDVYENPKNQYTKSLLESIPIKHPKDRK